MRIVVAALLQYRDKCPSGVKDSEGESESTRTDTCGFVLASFLKYLLTKTALSFVRFGA